MRIVNYFLCIAALLAFADPPCLGQNHTNFLGLSVGEGVISENLTNSFYGPSPQNVLIHFHKILSKRTKLNLSAGYGTGKTFYSDEYLEVTSSGFKGWEYKYNVDGSPFELDSIF